MRKIAPLSALALLLLACSLANLPPLLPGLATVPPTYTPVLFPSPTFVPPTHTSTPTLIGLRPSSTPTETPVATSTLSLRTPTAMNTIIGPAISPTAMPGATGFDSILISVSQIYTGKCGKDTVDFDVQVTYPAKVESVVIFFRTRNVLSGEETNWDRGTAMEDEGKGRFTYRLNASRFGDQNNAWILYQLVGTDDEQNNVARSPIFSDTLSLLKCP